LQRPRSLIAAVSSLCLLVIFCSSSVFAYENPDRPLTRGEGVDIVINSFNLMQKKSRFISSCLEHVHECFFVFSAMSDFDGISLGSSISDLILYPDVHNRMRYFGSINIASMLGLVHGYLNDDQTPFKPESAITRIQALKVVLGAGDLMAWKEKFELDEIETVLYEDTEFNYEYSWWYPRYLNFALDEDIISKERYFRPHEPITECELNDMIVRAQKAQARIANNQNDTQVVASGDTTEQAVY
jgi:hypothetical protein